MALFLGLFASPGSFAQDVTVDLAADASFDRGKILTPLEAEPLALKAEEVIATLT